MEIIRLQLGRRNVSVGRCNTIVLEKEKSQQGRKEKIEGGTAVGGARKNDKHNKQPSLTAGNQWLKMAVPPPLPLQLMEPLVVSHNHKASGPLADFKNPY